jgi:hypothetical protein
MAVKKLIMVFMVVHPKDRDNTFLQTTHKTTHHHNPEAHIQQSKYIYMPHHQTVGQNYCIKVANTFLKVQHSSDVWE